VGKRDHPSKGRESKRPPDTLNEIGKMGEEEVLQKTNTVRKGLSKKTEQEIDHRQKVPRKTPSQPEKQKKNAPQAKIILLFSTP